MPPHPPAFTPRVTPLLAAAPLAQRWSLDVDECAVSFVGSAHALPACMCLCVKLCGEIRTAPKGCNQLSLSSFVCVYILTRTEFQCFRVFFAQTWLWHVWRCW